jgi:hypothetical protein
MDLFLASLIIITLALLASSRLAYRMRRSRLFTVLFSGGWLPLLAGVVLQLALRDITQEGMLLNLRPLIMTALGWIGLMVGMQARRDVMRALPSGIWRLSVADVLISILFVGGYSMVMLLVWSDITTATGISRLVEPASMLAACGIGWALETRSLSVKRDDADAVSSSVLRSSGSLGVIFAIAFFGFIEILAGLSDHGAWSFDPLGMTRMLVTTAALAFSMGFVGRYGLRLAGKHKAEQLVVFLGLVAFVAGIASRLGISPLFASMLTGIVIANLAGSDLRLFERFIFQAEPIVGAVFALLAGMLMQVTVGMIELGFALGIVAMRVLIKPIVWSSFAKGAGGAGRGWTSVAPLRQGRLAIALGVSLYLVVPSDFTARLLTIIVIAGLLCDLIALTIIQLAERRSGGLEPGEEGAVG